MTRRQRLTVAQLKSLFTTTFQLWESEGASFTERLRQALGSEMQEEAPEAVAIKDILLDWLSDLFAHRLKRNRRSTPLISNRDLTRFVPALISEIERIGGQELEAKDRKQFEKFVKAVFTNLSEAAERLSPSRRSRRDPYDECWRWVDTVLAVATERGVFPTELPGLDGAFDETVRRMFTKRQFAAHLRKSFSRCADADLIKEATLKPLLELAAAEGGDKCRREAEQQLETDIFPQLQVYVEKVKVVLNEWIRDEARRIYAPA